MNHTIQLLCDYLQGILHHPETASLDISLLPSDFRPLGSAMAALAEQIRKAQDFIQSVARGDLSVNPPEPGNVLTIPLARLQDTLCRITWQAQQAAGGNYTQQIEGFGSDFAEAFNSITAQLQASIENAEIERQVLLDSIRALDDTSWELEQSNQELKNNLALVKALTDYTNNMIFVYSVDTNQEVHINRSSDWFMKSYPQTAEQLVSRLIERQSDIQHLIEQKTGVQESAESHQDSVIWNIELDRPCGKGAMFYQVESFLIPWFGLNQTETHSDKRHAVVHIVMDETERKKQQNMIYRLAYIDPLTKLNNRRYAMEKMGEWRQKGTAFTLSFIDVDYLKYYNDTFGHERGDDYLMEISNALQTLGGEVCRVGGDEFFLLQTDISPGEQDERLEQLRKTLQTNCDNGCPRSFSYASSLVPAGTDVSLEVYIRDADAKMYQYKQKYKVPLKDVLYRDERL